jgi:hypothetical protein
MGAKTIQLTVRARIYAVETLKKYLGIGSQLV